MKKRLITLFVLMMVYGFAFSQSPKKQAPLFSVSKPVIQNMVANSSQNLNFQLSTKSVSSVVVHCRFQSSSPYLSYSFNNSGCTASQGGVGINDQLSVTVVFTISLSAGATGTINGTLTFEQPSQFGQHYSVNIPIRITVPSTTNRTITFKNYCPYSVYFGLSSSSVPAKNNPTIACTTNSDCSSFAYSTCVNGFCGGGACHVDSDCLNPQPGTCSVTPGNSTASCSYCASDSDCITGGQCNTTNHLCYWITPSPTDAAVNHYELAAYSGGTPAQDTVTLTDYSNQNGYSQLWSGGFAGRTGCVFAVNQYTCKTATCNINGSGDGQGGCSLGEGFFGPTTLAEVTFISKAPDTYDVSIINGTNIPVAMYPTAAATPQAYANPYLCGNTGGAHSIVTNNGTLGGCSWQFLPPNNNLGFQWVDNDNATPCTQNSTCTSINPNYRCGLTLASVQGNLSQKTCGTLLGYWNQNEICVQNASYNADPSIVNCTLTNVGGSGNSIINLFACTGNAATSCYNVGSASSTCCGCTNWQNQGVQIPTNSSIVAQCLFNNPNWGDKSSATGGNGLVLPALIWFKQACPSAYVYPFDDKASTFTCPANGGQSAVNYTVEFCPQ